MTGTIPAAGIRPTPPERLRLTGSRAPSEHVDGAWWPHSRRLSAELPELLDAVRDRLGRVALVGYRHDGWLRELSPIDVGEGRSVELLGFRSDEPPTVILIGDDGHHLTLHVIDPQTNPEEAEETLNDIPRRAAVAARRTSPAAQSVADVAKKLADHEGRNSAERDAEILEWCEDAADQFEEARIQTFIPILVEHIVNNRIHRERHQAALAASGDGAARQVR